MLPSAAFPSIQVPNGLNDAYPQQGGQSTLFSLLIQIPTPSRNSLTDTPEIMFILGTLGPSQVDT